MKGSFCVKEKPINIGLEDYFWSNPGVSQDIHIIIGVVMEKPTFENVVKLVSAFSLPEVSGTYVQLKSENALSNHACHIIDRSLKNISAALSVH